MPSLETNRLLLVAADAADSRKAEDITILALDPNESSLTDYFLICTATNDRQTGAIADEIEYRLKTEFGTYPNSVEGRRQGEWVLMDYVDFVVHIFLPEKREYYGLERLRKTATYMSVGDVSEAVQAAVAETRRKNPVKKAEPAVAKKSVAKKAAAAKKAPAKTAVKKSAAKKAPAKAAAKKKSPAKK